MVLATKRSIEQLEKIFSALGVYGGTIITNNPDNWWELDLEVEYIDGEDKRILIGICSTINDDIVFDPMFTLNLKIDSDNKIVDAIILGYESTTALGTVYSGEDDVLYGFGMKEKAGMRKLFSSFMTNITEIGPYLTEPKKIKKYTKTLAD